MFYGFFVQAQTITTFAGNGSNIYNGDNGQATTAAIGEPEIGVFDVADNFYFSDVLHNVVRKITPNGIITTIAGTGSGGYNGDNITATSAELHGPGGIAFDSVGNIYISEELNSRIRRIDAVTGIISTIAGNGTWGYGGDGQPASASILYNPGRICFDRFGNLFINDPGNFRIRKINTMGIISTVAGNGVSGDTGDGGMATAANIEDMVGLCTDEIGNFYFAELGLRVRKVTIATGLISEIAGIDPEGSVASGDGGPATAASIDPYDLSFDKTGNLFVSGYLFNDVRKIDNSGIIHTVAGNGIAGYNGDNIPATSAELNSPLGICFDSCGNLYISELRNYRIRKVALNPTCNPAELNTIKNEQVINIYPNPTSNQLNINNIKSSSYYHLLNIVGEFIQYGKLNEGNNDISLQSLPSGIYLLVIIDEQKNKTLSKIVKQ